MTKTLPKSISQATKELLKLAIIADNGYMIFQPGDYSNIKKFPNRCLFQEGSKFAPNTSFGERSVFGRRISFGTGTTFEKGCIFLANCNFESRCIFGEGCKFAEKCTFVGDNLFCDNCTFHSGCFLGNNNSYGLHCTIIELPGREISLKYSVSFSVSDTLFPKLQFYMDANADIYVRCGKAFGTMVSFQKLLDRNLGIVEKEFLRKSLDLARIYFKKELEVDG